ncbi:MAG: restriction endonuclease [Rhodanobacter sp.]|jgi:hypothetical protein
MSEPEWKRYQQATADVFRRLGCNAQEDLPVAGVRATHAVDVHATFLRAGILCTWIIECKLWKSRVTKEKVLALKSIVEDVGADRGIIVSEMGFQSGAQDAARGTNITLVTSLKEFERTALAATSEVPLGLVSASDPIPFYRFPQHAPHELLLVGDTLITTNWQDGSISLVDPARKVIARTFELDKYEAVSPRDGARVIRTHPPGNLVFADGRLFLGQVFSEVVVVIDLATQAIIKRIPVPGGGEGEMAASPDQKAVYFASNKTSHFFIIDSATYAFEVVPYPSGGRGCMSLLRHPTKPLLYIGISRGGRIAGRAYPHANCYVATYDLARRDYVSTAQLAEVTNGQTDDATPACLTYDAIYERVYVGMFQSRRGISVLDPDTGEWRRDVRFERTSNNTTPFPWVDPLRQAIAGSLLLSLNRHNRELVSLDRESLEPRASIYLGEGRNGPSDLIVWEDFAVVSHPALQGLHFVPLSMLA